MKHRHPMPNAFAHAGLLMLIVLLSACGGDGGDSRQFNTLGGTIDMQLVNAPSGVISGLVLNDGTETYAVTLQTGGQTSSKSAFTFPTL